MLKTKPLKPKRCKASSCGEYFTPRNGFQVACSPRCANQHAVEKRIAHEQKIARKELKDYREKNKSIGKLTAEAQSAFNAFIRERDRGLPCASCGRYERELQHCSSGGLWDCGHYLGVGAHPELRFHEANAARQCKHCNRDKSGFPAGYRKTLIIRIGVRMLNYLEGPVPQSRFRHDDLREIKQYYREKLRWINSKAM